MNYATENNSHGTLERRAKILIVDDHELVRDGLRQLIDKQPDLKVCGEASNVNDAKQSILQLSPDVVIVDLRLEKSSGLDLIKWIAERLPETKILVCSMHSEQSYGERVLRLGAVGFLSKVNDADATTAAIRKVMAGGLFFSDELIHQVLRRSSPNSKSKEIAESPVASLSDRELEILTLLGQGFTSEAIAQRLFLSRNTVGTYRERLKHKLNLNNGSELIRFAIRWVEDCGYHNEQHEVPLEPAVTDHPSNAQPTCARPAKSVRASSERSQATIMQSSEFSKPNIPSPKLHVTESDNSKKALG